MRYCTRIFEFDAGHRVVGHEGKCKYLHGHRYKLHAQFEAKDLDLVGRVIDFSTIKDRLGNWINENLDHTCILWSKDEKLGFMIESETGQKIYYINSNPTAENIANHILNDIIPNLFKDLKEIVCKKITIFETPNCYVECEIE